MYSVRDLIISLKVRFNFSARHTSSVYGNVPWGTRKLPDTFVQSETAPRVILKGLRHRDFATYCPKLRLKGPSTVVEN